MHCFSGIVWIDSRFCICFASAGLPIWQAARTVHIFPLVKLGILPSWHLTASTVHSTDGHLTRRGQPSKKREDQSCNCTQSSYDKAQEETTTMMNSWVQIGEEDNGKRRNKFTWTHFLERNGSVGCQKVTTYKDICFSKILEDVKMPLDLPTLKKAECQKKCFCEVLPTWTQTVL